MATRVFTEEELELLRRVREAVESVEPDAQVIVYGSRARGEAEEDSDWDILVLVKGPADTRRKTVVRHRVYDVEFETGAVLSTIVDSRDDWETELHRAMPFHANVEREGVWL